MALTLAATDRVAREYEVTTTDPDGTPATVTAVAIALIAPRSSPSASTVWTTVPYAAGVATVTYAAPAADPAGALVVPATCDAWMRVTSTGQVDAEKLERITILDGGAPLAAPTGVPVVSVNGETGSAITLTAADVGALAVGAGAGGALSGTYPNPGLNETTVDNIVAADITDPGTATGAAARAALKPIPRKQIVGGGVYTLTLDDAYKQLFSSVTGLTTFTVPTNSTVPFPVGAVIELNTWVPGSTMEIVGASGVGVYPPAGYTETVLSSDSTVRLHYVGSDDWELAWGLTPATPTEGHHVARMDWVDEGFQRRSHFDVRYYGAAVDGITDDAPEITAAIAAAVAAGGGVVLIPGRCAIASRVTIPDLISIEGVGGGLDPARPGFLCTAAGAGLTFSGTGNGGVFYNFTVDGDDIATNPVLCTGLNAQRTFLSVDVIDALEDNWIVETCQNYAFLSCSSQGAGRDNLVLDKSTGGHLFTRFESNGAARHALRSSQANPGSDYGTGGYFAPTHIKFDHSLFERGTTNAQAVKLEAGAAIVFADPVIQGSASGMTAPLASLASGVTSSIIDPIFSGISTQVAALQVANGSTALVTGRVSVVGPATAFDVASGGQLILTGAPALGGGSVLFTGGTDRNVSVFEEKRAPQRIRRQAAGDTVLDIAVDGETGSRVRWTADGTLQVGDGSNFTWGTNLFRRGDSHWGSSVGLALGGAFSANGATPRTKHTLGAAATDLATVIALANNIRTALINNGIGQA